ncbi:MAG TPA: EAL domain-containing protein [Gallionella sp.]
MTRTKEKKILSTPKGLIFMIGLLVLVVELLIMALINVVFEPMFGADVTTNFWAILDPVILTILITPAVYILAVRPLERQQGILREQNNELRISAVTFESQEGVVVTDLHNRILRVNHSFTEITGYSNEEVINKTPSILQSGRQDKEFYRNMWLILERDRFWSGEVWNRRKNGEIYPEWLTITAVVNPSGKVTNYVGIFSDITERKALDAEIQNLAFYDPLTHLPNRRLLLNRLEQAMATTTRNHYHGALMFLDLDHFKTLNDVYGHNVGDQLLIMVAERIGSCVREQDSVSRFGGDEFVVMLEELSENAEHAAVQAETVAKKIRNILSTPYELHRDTGDAEGGSIQYICTSSIGVTMFKGQDNDIATLLKWADMAMYQAKISGRNAIRFFDPVMQSAIEAHASFESDLRAALEQQQFKLYYQIQVDASRRPQGAEALLRWEHPQRGMVSPHEFIPLAEETGLIVSIGQWALNAACAQLGAWKSDPEMRNLQLAVNISAKQFLQRDFVGQVKATIEKHGVSPMFLKLELTESMLLSNIEDTIRKMQELKDYGVRFSLDDFGTGYSSLSNLKRLPLDQIKIDQGFVRNIAQDRGDVAMVHAIMDLGMNFGLEIIAEGVETEEQFKTLQRYGCTNFQGYLFSRPVPLEQFESLIQ